MRLLPSLGKPPPPARPQAGAAATAAAAVVAAAVVAAAVLRDWAAAVAGSGPSVGSGSCRKSGMRAGKIKIKLVKTTTFP